MVLGHKHGYCPRNMFYKVAQKFKLWQMFLNWWCPVPLCWPKIDASLGLFCLSLSCVAVWRKNKNYLRLCATLWINLANICQNVECLPMRAFFYMRGGLKKEKHPFSSFRKRRRKKLSEVMTPKINFCWFKHVCCPCLSHLAYFRHFRDGQQYLHWNAFYV